MPSPRAAGWRPRGIQRLTGVPAGLLKRFLILPATRGIILAVHFVSVCLGQPASSSSHAKSPREVGNGEVGAARQATRAPLFLPSQPLLVRSGVADFAVYTNDVIVGNQRLSEASDSVIALKRGGLLAWPGGFYPEYMWWPLLPYKSFCFDVVLIFFSSGFPITLSGCALLTSRGLSSFSRNPTKSRLLIFKMGPILGLLD